MTVSPRRWIRPGTVRWGRRFATWAYPNWATCWRAINDTGRARHRDRMLGRLERLAARGRS